LKSIHFGNLLILCQAVDKFQGHSEETPKDIAISTNNPVLISLFSVKNWPVSHRQLPAHVQLTICEILCITKTILPKEVKIYLIQKIIEMLENTFW